MSRFNETVAKIASSPYKQRALRNVLPHVTKEAGKGVSGSSKILDTQAYRDIITNIAGTAGAAAITGAGALGVGALHDHLVGNTDILKSKHQEEGKLQAQTGFKKDLVTQLTPQHDKVLKEVMKDEVVSKADDKMIRSAYTTMKRFAPNLAADKNAALSFLREHAIYGTGPSYASLKNLAEAEQAVARAGGATDL